MWHFVEQYFIDLPSWLKSFILLLFPFFDLHSRLSLVYAVGFIGLGFGSYWLSKRFTNFSWREAVDYCFPKSLYASHSTTLDWQCYLINGVLKVVISMTAIASMTAAIATFIRQILDSTFGTVGIDIEINFLFICGHTLFGILVLDFGAFITHYWLHKVPILWEFHKVHHIAEGLTPITGFRDHPIDVVFKKTLRAFILGIYLGGFNYITNSQVDIMTIGGVIVSTFLFDFTINLRHSHIWISYGWHLEHILCSPAMHQIHHSKDNNHIGKNFSLIFSFWDYLFGTIYIPTQRELLSVGIAGEADYENIWQLYSQPFAKAYERIERALRLRLRSPYMGR